jgi:hypothetical protein
METPYPIPECFGRFVCLDDCMVSCAYWEECMEASEEEEEEEAEG